MSPNESVKGNLNNLKAFKASEASKEVPKAKTSSAADVQLLEDLKQSYELPIPSKDAYWQLHGQDDSSKFKKSLLSIFKKKELTDEELSLLRQEAESAPGRARVKIQMLSKKYESSSSLKMLSAICGYRMIKNSSNRRGVVEGLRNATRESAIGLLDDGISLYNCENFFNIYFEYLTKFKRFQITTYQKLREKGGYQSSKKMIATAIKTCDSLLEEKTRALKVLNHIKGKFKSSSFVIPWTFNDIQKAGKKVEQNEFRAVCGPAEAREVLVYTLGLADIFARIPILFPLIDSVLKLIPETTTSFCLRKSAIQTTRAFTQLTIAVRESDFERMRTLGKQIFKTANDDLVRIRDQAIKQGFEADPYFNLSRVAVLTFGVFEPKEQKVVLLTAMKAMNRVVKLDMTKNHVYTDSALTMVKKLDGFLTEKPAGIN